MLEPSRYSDHSHIYVCLSVDPQMAASGIDYPVINLPVMKWANEYEEHCKMAPMIMMDEPRKIVLRRPKGLPMKMQEMAPKKHPTL